MAFDDPFFGEAIRIESDAAAGRYGARPSQVLALFEKMADSNWMEPNFPWNTALDEAVYFLGPAWAIHLFETADLTLLSRRVALVDYLAHPTTPLFTINQFATELETVVAAQTSNRTALLATGYPQKPFPTSPWVTLRLACALPVKDGHAELVQGRYRYRWPLEWQEPGWSIPIAGGLMHMSPVAGEGETKRYAQAPLIGTISPEFADNLAALRSRLLDVRSELALQLASLLRGSAVDEIWPSTIKLLTDEFTASEVDMLLKHEELVHAWNPIAETHFQAGLAPLAPRRGGIRDLLEIAGQCEAELRIGSYATTRPSLTLADGRLPVSYYQVVEDPRRAIIETALDRFLTLDPVVQRFWEEFTERVNTSIANEFMEPVIVTVMVRRPLARRFEPVLQSWAEYQKQAMEAGLSPDLSLSAARDEPSHVHALPAEVEESYRRYGLRSKKRIHIVNNTQPRGKTQLQIDGRPLALAPRLFRLFLRLVLALYESDHGYVSRGNYHGGGLADEGYYDAANGDRVVSDLRGALGDMRLPDGNYEMVEVDGAGQIRLSLHLSLVTADWRWLVESHPDDRVRELAAAILPLINR